MAKGVVALQTTEMIGGGSVREAIRVAGGDVQRVEDSQTVLQIRNYGRQIRCHVFGQIAIGTAKPMTPHLLAQMQVQGLERLLHSLMGREAGPFVMARFCAQARLIQIGTCLMKLVGGAVHGGHCGAPVAKGQP